MKRVSVIFPIYNRIALTREGLHSIYEKLALYYDETLHQVSYSVVIVDDGSTDGSSEMIRENYPQVHLLQGDGTLWWSGGVNVCAKYAIETIKADYVLLWNDDTFMDNQYFTNLAKILKDDDSTSILGTYIYEHPRTDKIWCIAGYFNRFFGIRKRIRKSAEHIDCQWLPGMGTIVPVHLIEELGYWDYENFPQYCGDADFTLRAQAKGIKLIPRPELRMWNKVKHSSFIARESWGDYRKSLVMIQSRYNWKIEAKFLSKHSKTPLWVIYFTYKQLEYFFGFLNRRYFRSYKNIPQ